MQSTQTPSSSPANQANPAAAPQAAIPQDSGFNPIPTRMQELAPLVVDQPNETGEAVVEQLEALETQLASVHAISAEAYMSQGAYEKALQHIEVSVSFATDDARYQNQCGYLRYLTGNDQGAIECFEQVVSQVPDQIDALCNLGMVHFGQEDYGTAREWFVKAVQIDQTDAELWNNLGAATFQAGDIPEAAKYFRAALSIDPNNEDAKANLAAC